MSMPLQFALVYGILAAAGEGHAPENDSIRKDRLKADLVFLWGDAFRGRLPATPENYLATEYVASRFSRLGLRPVTNDGSFFLRLQFDHGEGRSDRQSRNGPRPVCPQILSRC